LCFLTDISLILVSWLDWINDILRNKTAELLYNRHTESIFTIQELSRSLKKVCVKAAFPLKNYYSSIPQKVYNLQANGWCLSVSVHRNILVFSLLINLLLFPYYYRVNNLCRNNSLLPYRSKVYLPGIKLCWYIWCGYSGYICIYSSRWSRLFKNGTGPGFKLGYNIIRIRKRHSMD